MALANHRYLLALITTNLLAEAEGLECQHCQFPIAICKEEERNRCFSSRPILKTHDLIS